MTKYCASDCRLAGPQMIRQSLITCGAGQCQATALPYLPHQSLSGTRWILPSLTPPLHRQPYLSKNQPATLKIQHQLLLLLGKRATCCANLLGIRAMFMQQEQLHLLFLLPLNRLHPPLPVRPLPLHLIPLRLAHSQLYRCSRELQGSQMHTRRDTDPLPQNSSCLELHQDPTEPPQILTPSPQLRPAYLPQQQQQRQQLLVLLIAVRKRLITQRAPQCQHHQMS